MNENIMSLQRLLEEESTLHDGLVKTALAMNKAIIERNLNGIREASLRYDEYVGQLETLEERRLALSDAIAAQLGRTGGHINVNAIADALTDASLKKKLLESRNRLKEKTLELQRINSSNRILLEDGLDMIGKTFECITRKTNPPQGYRKGGAVAGRTGGRSIINRIA